MNWMTWVDGVIEPVLERRGCSDFFWRLVDDDTLSGQASSSLSVEWVFFEFWTTTGDDQVVRSQPGVKRRDLHRKNIIEMATEEAIVAILQIVQGSRVGHYPKDPAKT